MRLEPDAMRDLLAATYRGARHSMQERVKRLERMDVTLASEIFILKPERDPTGAPRNPPPRATG
ncbi:MAG: hypothetical protein HC813_04095, partial [Planctomycetes bacterium]|nr:hypothetical protein [Planctomycetota bacterium]